MLVRCTANDDKDHALGPGVTLPSTFVYLTDKANPESEEWKRKMVRAHNNIHGSGFKLNEVKVAPYKLTIGQKSIGYGLFGPATGIPANVILGQVLGEKVTPDSSLDERFSTGNKSTGIINSERRGNIFRFIDSCGAHEEKANVSFFGSYGKIYATTKKEVGSLGELLMEYDATTPPSG